MKKGQKRLLIVVAVLMSLPILSFLLNPIHRPEDEIRGRLLKKTPIGSDLQTVEKVIRSSLKEEPEFNKWQREIILELGSHFTHQIIGFWFPTVVFAHWEFDENYKLIEIKVKKEIDAP